MIRNYCAAEAVADRLWIKFIIWIAVISMEHNAYVVGMAVGGVQAMQFECGSKPDCVDFPNLVLAHRTAPATRCVAQPCSNFYFYLKQIKKVLQADLKTAMTNGKIF